MNNVSFNFSQSIRGYPGTVLQILSLQLYSPKVDSACIKNEHQKSEWMVRTADNLNICKQIV
jgi:hypothetical protein